MGKDGGKRVIGKKTPEVLPVVLLPAGNLLSTAFLPIVFDAHVFFFSLLGAIAEEFFFRGLLLKTILLPRIKPCLAILITAILFSAMHLFNLQNGTALATVLLQIFCAFCFSVWAGSVVWQKGSIRLPLLAHLLLNLTAVTEGILLSTGASILVLADGLLLIKENISKNKTIIL